jgi:hypothetical protein
MKSDFPFSLHQHTGSADEVATAVARLLEENEMLRRLAAHLSSQLELTLELAAQGRQSSH